MKGRLIFIGPKVQRKICRRALGLRAQLLAQSNAQACLVLCGNTGSFSTFITWRIERVRALLHLGLWASNGLQATAAEATQALQSQKVFSLNKIVSSLIMGYKNVMARDRTAQASRRAAHVAMPLPCGLPLDAQCFSISHRKPAARTGAGLACTPPPSCMWWLPQVLAWVSLATRPSTPNGSPQSPLEGTQGSSQDS